MNKRFSLTTILLRRFFGALMLSALQALSAVPDEVAPGVAPSNPARGAAPGRGAQDYTPEHPRSLALYFAPATAAPKAPDRDGFLQRWLLPEPISKPNRSNTVFTDTCIRGAFTAEYFPIQFTVVPRPGDEVAVAEVATNWLAGRIDVRIGDYMLRPHQKWTITAVTDAGGYLGSLYFKISLAGTDRVLAATDDAEVVTVPAFTGRSEEQWRIDQLTEGTYRIMPKAAFHRQEPMALTAVGSSTPTLAKFDAQSDQARWTFKTP